MNSLKILGYTNPIEATSVPIVTIASDQNGIFAVFPDTTVKLLNIKKVSEVKSLIKESELKFIKEGEYSYIDANNNIVTGDPNHILKNIEKDLKILIHSDEEHYLYLKEIYNTDIKILNSKSVSTNQYKKYFFHLVKRLGEIVDLTISKAVYIGPSLVTVAGIAVAAFLFFNESDTKNVSNKTVDAIKNVANKADDATKNAASQAVDATKNAAGKALNATKNAAGSSGYVDIRKLKRGDKIPIKNVNFSVGLATLNKSSYVQLNKLIEIMSYYPKLRVKIEGHTDNTGDPYKNSTLSRNRANACFKYLVNKGIRRNRLTFYGKGGTEPISINSTAEGRRQNRRVEFYIN